MTNAIWAGADDALDQKDLALEKQSWILLAASLAVLVLSRILVFGSFEMPEMGTFFETVGMSPSNASSFAAVAILYLLARPPRNHRIALAMLAVLFEAIYLMNLPYQGPLFFRLLVFGGGIGLASLVGLLHLAVLGRSSPARRRARTFLRLGIILTLYSVVSGAMIGSLSYLTPEVYDAYAYNLEGTLGFFPSFEVARWQAMHPIWIRVLDFIYARLLIWVLLAFALNYLYRNRCYSSLFPAFALSGFVGLIYAYCLPMVGMGLLLGIPPWPYGPVPASVSLSLVPAPAEYPRTCIPSMHTCWILIAYFVIARLSPRWRALYLVLVATTLISALGPRVGHYFLDFVGAFSFAVSWQAITANPLPSTRTWRVGGFIAGQLVTVGYYLSIRWYISFWLSYSYLFWTLSLVIVAASLAFESRLARLTLESSSIPEP